MRQVTLREFGLLAMCGILAVALDNAQQHVKRLRKVIAQLKAELAAKEKR